MKIYLFDIIILISIGMAACSEPVTYGEAKSVDWELQPEIPTKDALDQWCTDDIKLIVRKQKDASNECDLYYLNNEVYTGWACEIIPNNPHKFRYEQFEKGKMIRRLGYYDNGQIDADFRLKDCKNYGPSRMWLYDGKMYIDEFYGAPGVQHGLQRQWYDNGVLAKESKFEYGVTVYQKKFDRNGILITQE